MSDNAIISPQKRTKSLIAFFTILVVVGAAATAYWWFVASRYVETDNAYVSGDLIPVSAQVSGQIMSLLIEENHGVSAGQLALTIDDTDAKIALRQTEANVEREKHAVSALFSNTRQSTISIQVAQNQLKATELALAQARINHQNAEKIYQRRLSLKTSAGAVSEENLSDTHDKLENMKVELDLARVAVVEARLALDLAKEQAAAAHAQTDGVQASTHPNIRLAEQAYAQALVNLGRTKVKIPMEGVVAKRYVQLGQRVSPQQPLLSVVSLPTMFIDANFKETQTRDLAPGQCAEIISDRFGSKIAYHSVVESIGIGTGSVFSRVPVQNASGNWVKIVQRVPVRLRLSQEELKKYPLSLGMSTVAKVKLGSDCHHMLSTLSPANTLLDVNEKELVASGKTGVAGRL